jgi:hypothetical protein
MEWFEKKKIDAQTPNCEVECASSGVGMGTFTCPMSCSELCGEKKYKVRGSKLCEEEVKLAVLSPSKLLKAKELALDASAKTNQIFTYNSKGDESDAFRHYYWSGLLTHEFGSS